MDNYYVACELGEEAGRVMLGTLSKGRLTMSEIHRFPNEPVPVKDSLHWNVPNLYREVLRGLRELSAYDEPVDSVSCTSWGGDYLLFDPHGSLMTPTFHNRDPRTQTGFEEVAAKIRWESLYEETGVDPAPGNTLFQLIAETPKRLKRTKTLLPVADGINYLLSGAARIELSQACATQLYNPAMGTWSDRLLAVAGLSPAILPQLILAGAKLGSLLPEVAKETRLQQAQVLATCSHELAAALAGLPVESGESWAFMRAGSRMILGTPLIGPIIDERSRELGFTNGIGFGGSAHFYKHVAGLWLLDECKRYWKEADRELDEDILTHLAIGAPPFESLINLDDPRFHTPGDMPLKIQAYCSETNQAVPRKPGAILRCVLESLALLYRRTLHEIEAQTGRQFTHLYLMGGSAGLLSHFTANALQIPVTIAPPNTSAIGNVIVQALALGHVRSLAQAREILRGSFKTETIKPHAAVWNEAYDRLAELVPS